MTQPDLPHGVPNPYVAHVHPYPTRFHGAIPTRPVFGFPWVRTPYAVWRNSRLDGLGKPYIDPTFRPYHGMGNEGDWDVASGVFRRPRYDGGGLFNDVSGLGAVPGGLATFLVAGAIGFGVVAYFVAKK